jgi:hypothetical protein
MKMEHITRRNGKQHCLTTPLKRKIDVKFENGEETIDDKLYWFVDDKSYTSPKEFDIARVFFLAGIEVPTDFASNEYELFEKAGSKIYMKNGNFHRLDGPAVEYANGKKEFYVEGNQLTLRKLHNLLSKGKLQLASEHSAAALQAIQQMAYAVYGSSSVQTIDSDEDFEIWQRSFEPSEQTKVSKTWRYKQDAFCIYREGCGSRGWPFCKFFETEEEYKNFLNDPNTEAEVKEHLQREVDKHGGPDVIRWEFLRKKNGCYINYERERQLQSDAQTKRTLDASSAVTIQRKG